MHVPNKVHTSTRVHAHICARSQSRMRLLLCPSVLASCTSARKAAAPFHLNECVASVRVPLFAHACMHHMYASYVCASPSRIISLHASCMRVTLSFASSSSSREYWSAATRHAFHSMQLHIATYYGVLATIKKDQHTKTRGSVHLHFLCQQLTMLIAARAIRAFQATSNQRRLPHLTFSGMPIAASWPRIVAFASSKDIVTSFNPTHGHETVVIN